MTDKITKYVSLSLNGICKLKKDDIVVVALSGGMDSMCLFDVTYKLSNDYGFKMMALHVHHGIRGKDADRDLEFVENYCKSFDVPFIKCKVKAKTYAKENGLTIEEAARILRYKEIDNVWKKVLSKNPDSCVYILLAHHMRDQVETIIHNILRGTGVKGLSGMNDMRDYIIRPMLNVSKDDIEKYVKNYAIPYVEDLTNKDDNYTRNYIRHEILDKFVKVNNKSFEHIIELSKQAREMNDYIESVSDDVFKKILIEETKGKEIIINVVLFKDIPHIVKVGVIRHILNNLIDTLKDITKINIEDIIDMSMKEKGGHIDIPYNITVDKIKKELIFKKNDINISMKKRKKK